MSDLEGSWSAAETLESHRWAMMVSSRFERYGICVYVPRLVTLSACDTGTGRLLGQEGIASLERAFLLAGAKSVIASLWPTDDTFTVAFMKRLYQHVSNGADKGMALRQAKLDVLKEFADEALPVYWAGFTLVGDGSTAIHL